MSLIFENILVVFNPASGGGQKNFVLEVIEHLKQAGCLVDLYDTKAPEDATQFLQSLTKEYDLIIAAGGDGTTNEVVNGLLDKDTPLAVIPVGTTNVLANELGLPRSPERLAKAILKGKIRKVHLARMNKKRFVLMAGFGYDAWVVHGVNPGIKKRFGKLAYVLSMLQQIRPYGSKSYDVDVDGKIYKAKSVIITNGKYYGGSFILSRKANLSDPNLQVFLFRARNKLELLTILFSLPFGLIEKLPGLLSVPGKHIKISTNNSDVVQADGDFAGYLPVDVRIEPGTVPFVVA